jgi:hypothetical protein
MTSKFIGIGLLTAVASLSLAACGGGGSSPGVATPPQSAPQAALKATGTLTFTVPNKNNIASTPNGKKPAYVSTFLTAAALYIDGVGPTTATCTGGVCTVSFSTTAGSHDFGIEIDNGTAVLAEGTQIYSLHGGNNGALTPTLTLNGVAVSAGTFASGVTPGTETFSILDAAGGTIIPPGLFDNGPIAITSNDATVATITSPTSLASPDPSGSYTVTYSCLGTNSTPAPFNIVMNPTSTPAPGPTGITLPPSLSYGPATLPLATSPTITCTPAPATGGPITVQSRTRR